jgi:cation diffusion facilitator CzcD-associated flavoprotein CzcO
MIFKLGQSLFLLTLSILTLAGKVPVTEYDVIVIGGGPAGLSATSALCRVARKVIVFDSQQYRNGRTRNMHDVIGSDGKHSPTHNCYELSP